MLRNDTIIAISSAVGEAPRMIVRLSGPRALQWARALESAAAPPANTGSAVAQGAPPAPSPLPAAAPPAPAAATPFRRTRIAFAGVQCAVWLHEFTAPRSCTGEDIAELHLAGNPTLAGMLLQALVQRGARQAEAGEFTARAYFNGRIGLTQAEGVAAAIHAQNEAELRASRQLMAGALARRLQPVMDALAQALALLEAGIDFSDQDVRFTSDEEAARSIDGAAGALRNLLAQSASLERIDHTPVLALVGRPNAGKSTLLNALAGFERAVVSDVAGTTRDALLAPVPLRRGWVQLADAAGLADLAATDHLHATADLANTAALPGPAGADGARAEVRIAALMDARARESAATADFILHIVEWGDRHPMPAAGRPPDLRIVTKIDRAPMGGDHACDVNDFEPVRCIAASALTGQGMESLRDALDQLAFGAARESELALNQRHRTAVNAALSALDSARGALGAGDELVALLLREALDFLGQVVGQVTPDDVLGRVFSTFCIGK